MKSNLILAWRNLWRNRGRTLITIASVFFGVLISTYMSSMQEGSYTSMIDNMVKFYSGYLQIQHEEYWDNKTIDYTMVPTGEVLASIAGVPEIRNYTPRLESFALASSEQYTRGSLVIGIDPEREQALTGMQKWLMEGHYLRPGDKGALVASDLARYLNLSLNDTLVLIGVGYHGASAWGKFPIRGILKFPNPELNRQSLYLDIGTCQEFYGVEQGVTSLVLMVDDQYHLPKARKKLSDVLDSPYRLMTWDEMQPQLLQMVEADKAGAYVMKAILYLLIGFGIFGTVMMMVMERRREMGVMVAIGMQRSKLSAILFTESILIALLGVLAGFAGSVPLIAYYIRNPIPLTGQVGETMSQMGFEPYMYFSWRPVVFYEQLIIVFLITAVIALYPLLIARSFRVHLALRA
jgi:putative ABC transport system permease protein